MEIQGFYLMPHPPIVIPEVGRGQEFKVNTTLQSLHQLGKDIADKAPDTIILITPHGTMFEDAVALAYEERMTGNLGSFGASEISMDLPINKLLTNKIFELAVEEDLPIIMATHDLLAQYNASLHLDHGALVPLYFVNKYYTTYNLVHITYAPVDDMELYKLGILIQKAVTHLDQNAICIASGDLSHTLKEEGPYEYSPYGERFDKEFLQHLAEGDALGLLTMDEELICQAGECGRRSILLLLGLFEGKHFSGELLSYEGTLGVGYGVMRFHMGSAADSVLAKLEDKKNEVYMKKSDQKDPYVKLARESLTTYLTTGQEVTTLPDYIPEEMKNLRRGVFVSLKKRGELRGCIGTILPTTGCVAHEIIRNAIEAGIYDPRFYEVKKEELLDIDFSVDVLTEPVPALREELDPKEYGIIVRSSEKTGLLLPDLEGIDTVEQQVTIALQKAGIDSQENYSIEKFIVIRHKEE